MVGPDYQRPDLDLPEAYREPVATDPSLANIGWWVLFEDDTLVALIREALASNRDLGIALSRIDEAAAELGIVRANQFPFVDAQGSAGRLKQSQEILPDARSRSDYFLGAAASFEVDLWGKLRRATQAARADLLATEASARNVTITLVASVAGTYFLLLDLDDQLAISQRTLKSREDSLAIMEARFEKGTVPQLDVHQAEVEAADAEAAIARFNRLVRQAENSLSVLVGSNPRSIVRGMVLNQQSLPLDVPAGLPMSFWNDAPTSSRRKSNWRRKRRESALPAPRDCRPSL